jgi:formylglycine-generating enzyme required for sulfatase activity
VGDGKRARGKPTPDPHYAGSGYRHGKTHGVNAAPQGDGCLNRMDSRLLTLQVTAARHAGQRLYDEEVYGSYRIFRGGGWAESMRGCGASVRRRSHPSFAIDDLGFRLARTVS